MSHCLQYCMRVVGHRGGGYDYPENSLSAFQNCKDKGCSAVEFDLALTKDKVPIIFHDDTIERLTGQLGIINQMTWDELKNLDISARHPLSFYPLIIYMLRKRNSKIIGSLSYRPKFFSSITWSGSDGPGESRSNNIFKHLSNCFIDYVYDWALARFVYNIIGISTILLHKDVVNLQVINNWKNLGVRVIAWSINLPSEKLLYSKVYKITYFTDTLLTEKS
ncbi:glycerophosphodiester phosphodiesterase 1 [Aphidius gifuensis]|uniref:glycerophosphodiester phosphodiesterase 1 n=1 Tax=Aphidius gifuensis TaxID=684658 RepID=UPI001CDBD837|nr:glycerophosphodiester phosphodiesterase 1 [Aphidius gifuensis]